MRSLTSHGNDSYLASRALGSFTYGNGIVHTMTPNLRQLPPRSTNAYNGVAVFDDSLTYDGNGNVTSIADNLPAHRGNRLLSYDGRDRLMQTASPWFSATGADGTVSYTYSMFDNLTRVNVPATANVCGTK